MTSCVNGNLNLSEETRTMKHGNRLMMPHCSLMFVTPKVQSRILVKFSSTMRTHNRPASMLWKLPIECVGNLG